MKYLLILFISVNYIFALDVDTKMFDEKVRSSYLNDLEKKLQVDKQKALRPEKILIEESYYLERIKESINRKISIDELDTSKFHKKALSSLELLDLIKYLLNIKNRITTQDELIRDVQNKLSITKKQIENFVKEDKDNALLYQLQFAYFKVQKSNLEKRKELLEEYFDKLFKLTYSLIKNIAAGEEKVIIDKKQYIEKRIEIFLQKKAELEIQYDKVKLEENETLLLDISKRAENNNKLYQKELILLIDLNIRDILFLLKKDDKKNYLKHFAKIENYIIRLDKQYILEYKNLISILTDFAKINFGSTKILIAKSSSELKTILEDVKSSLTGTLFIFNEQAITFFSLLKAVALIVLGFFLGLIYKKWLKRVSSKWTNMSDMSLKISSNVGYYIIIFITFIIAISSLGIDLTSLSLIAGALSIGIGFGLQTVVSNLIAGIILMFERTIRIGDVIEINELLKGIVSDIRIRSTTIKTFDNIDIVIPNSSFVQNSVINWTLEDPTRRVHIPFSVAYGTKIEKVKECVLKELFASNLIFVRGVSGKEPEIRMEMMNASSVDLELLVWVKTIDKMQPNSLKSDFLIMIYNALYKYNIEIPFPQMDVHLNRKNNL